MFLRRLPEIQEELQLKLANMHKCLLRLPQGPSNNPFGDVMNTLNLFTADLHRHFQGVADEEGVMQAIHPAEEEFRKAIRVTAPEFRPYERGDVKETADVPLFLRHEEGKEDERVDAIDVDEDSNMSDSSKDGPKLRQQTGQTEASTLLSTIYLTD